MHPSAVTHNPATGRNYSYDANGNMLTRGNQTLTWDIDNRVTSVSIAGGGTTYMEYDYAGTRLKKNAPTGISLYPFQGYEIDPSGIITKFVRIGVENFASKRGTSKYFYHNDHLGSVNVITDINGTRCQLNEYEPWGGVSRSEPTNPACDPTHRFNGKELDPESGLYYYGGRYYDPEISRFISPDPFVQSPDNPQNLNRYSYVLNNPQNYIDPSGYFFFFPKAFWRAFARMGGVAKWIVKEVLPIISGSKFLPKEIYGVMQILEGIVRLYYGDFTGILSVVSGAASFGKSDGWETAHLVTGALSSLGSMYQQSALGGGSGVQGAPFQATGGPRGGSTQSIGEVLWSMFREGAANAAIKDDVSRLKRSGQTVWDFVTTIKGIQVGVQQGMIWTEDGRDKGGMRAGGIYWGADGFGKWTTDSTPYGSLNLFGTVGINVSFYRGSSPAGVTNTLNIGLGGSATISYDNNLRFENYTFGIRGISGGIGWTRDVTTIECWALCSR